VDAVPSVYRILQTNFYILPASNITRNSSNTQTNCTLHILLPSTFLSITTQQLTTPSTGIPAATALGYQEDGLAYHSSDWTTVDDGGTFSLTADGEAIFLYCVKGDSTKKPLLAFFVRSNE
jgi:hypothetical protein